ncbi:LacI family DNA-binding transcriptional regulator [Ruania alba]|uniref:DNA-binding transcriptional regulator, LacI/PurR family n=1 Tax=Ruania alba TaxID=648782 RepID=A0A1H5DC14_9MICO|nr:LacI family DNA-binding transcriptional regulator [Ruania alba]SED76379.1 DNA-binding transcriptional regulator, LacI/PurR family [Ruania alba]
MTANTRPTSQGPGRGPSMRDVATLAGVSTQTVSRTLSGHPYVRPDLRQRVMDAVAELGYTRNLAARALSSGQSGTLGVITLASRGYARIEFAYGVEQAAAAAGYSVITATANAPTESDLARAVTFLLEHGVDGLVVSTPLTERSDTLDALLERVPAVILEEPGTAEDGVLTVDQREVAQLATTHLLDLGHQTVWHLAGSLDWSDGWLRVSGWQETLEAADREVPPLLRGDWTAASGYEQGLLLSRMPDATAVFVANDEMAFGLLRALAERGRSVPEEVSVVSCDDIPLAAYATPPLTTVAQPFDATGRYAVEVLTARMGGHAAPEAAAPQPRLIIRGTTQATT